MRQISFRRRALSLVGIAAVSALALSGCSSSDKSDSNESKGSSSSETGKDTLHIGISQFAPHPALDAAAAGFKEAFADAGYVEGDTVEFDEQNAQGDVANASTVAQALAGGDNDLVLAIATPAAQAAAAELTDIPVLFTAVTDAVEAQLVDSNEAPGGNMTGTSDAVPAEALQAQFDLIKQLVPDTEKVGIIYASGEVNSEVQVEDAKEIAEPMGIEIVTQTVTTPNDIAQAAETLGDVDAIYVPTDNMVVNGIASLVKVAEDKQIPVIAAEAGTVEGGAIATMGIDYFALGKQTGEMALRILENGDDPATTPVEFASALATTVNPAAAERMGVELPDSLLDGADIVEE